jgi:exosortase A-associated hydrolase 2
MALPISFFLPGAKGNLFAMYYPPAGSAGKVEDVLYVHPFAKEMFASRNVIAPLCRELARRGFGVLTVDLYGCGDSSGDFGEASWEIWREDLTMAVHWLRERGGERLSLWGLRLGALQVMDLAARSRDSYRRLVLWQPVLSGETMVTQFLHMNADESYGGDLVARLTDPAQRKLLPSGQRIEVAGYELAAELMRSMDRERLAPLGKLVRAPIHWMEIGSDDSIRAESLRVIRQWQDSAVAVSTYKVSGVPFWFSAHSMDAARLVPHLRPMFGDAGDE